MPGSTAVKKLFPVPPHQYSSVPLWAWNDILTEEQIVTTLRNLTGQKVKQVLIHPRPRLITPHLTEQWFRLWKAALKEAEQLGRKRTLCETFGASGWDLRFEDIKRIGNWLYALGVNIIDEHISCITKRVSENNYSRQRPLLA